MKIKSFSIALATVVGLSSTSAEAWSPFKRNQNSDTAQHTQRQGILSRGARYIKQRVTFFCDSTNAGKIDGFRRCLESFLGSGVFIDKTSTVLAMDSSGKPISATVNRTEYKQDWFRRWYLLNMETEGLLNALLKTEQTLTEAEQAFQQAGGDLDTLRIEIQNQEQELNSLWEQAATSPKALSGLQNPIVLPSTGNPKLDVLQQKVVAIDSVLVNLQNQLNTAWQSFYALNQEIAQASGQSPQFTDTGGSTPLTEVPLPDALNPVFTVTRNIPNSPLLDAKFAASLEQFATKNLNVMKNFCNNFFNTRIDSSNAASGGGYEADYVRLSDTGSITPAMVQQYQTNKLAKISMQCSEASMIGLTWRKLYSLCGLEDQGSGIQACSDFSSAEVGTSQTQSS